MKVVSLSGLRTGHLYIPGNIPGIHLFEVESTPASSVSTICVTTYTCLTF